jgi:hypothetical protein
MLLTRNASVKQSADASRQCGAVCPNTLASFSFDMRELDGRFAVHRGVRRGVDDQRRPHVSNNRTDLVQIGQIQRGAVDRDYVAEPLQRTRELEANLAIYPGDENRPPGIMCAHTVTPYA